MPAVGTDFELRLRQLAGRRLAADLVVLAFSVGNDFLFAKGALDWLARRCFLARLARNAATLSCGLAPQSGSKRGTSSSAPPSSAERCATTPGAFIAIDS